MNAGGVLSGRVDVRIGRHVLRCVGEIAGIDDECKVGTATELVRSIDGIVEPFLEVGAECRGEMRSRGEPKNADAPASMCHSAAC